MRTIQSVLYERNKKDKAGIVKIRITEDGKSSYISTGVKLQTKQWNARTCQVKESDELDYEQLNRIIEDKLKEVIASFTENIIAKKETSFTGFFQKVIDRQTNHGTKIKYSVILAKVEAYLAYSKKKDLTFREITEDTVYDMRNFFLKKMENNTATHYLKVINGVIKKAIKANVHNYVRHPFEGVELKKSNKSVPKSLTAEQLQKIIDVKLDDARLEKYRRAFLFQVFCQGMRVSDLKVLRWNNFSDNRIEYTMLKTKKQMSVQLNDNLVQILTPLVESYQKKDESIRETIDRLSTSKKYKTNFVFGFLDNEEFSCINEKNDFSKLGKELYIRLNKKSIVYNRNLKVIQSLAGVKTNISSHTARHSYASLLLDSDVNLYTISQGLGHSSVMITQHYLSNFRSHKLDAVNSGLVDRFRM
ncbi:site-specific integrase [Pontibacter qinzhouensis]|uniref:Site-specific integrase n=1 Tax=Pontibacter qinzhouensis TaxID=2603253 RepID=A0A5C8IZ31_9BACT|nr:site-specific integrase [Pontibacter qinzhouensis]TXK26550.1 site-specific integrase [Pontibacter qinzhouensis]